MRARTQYIEDLVKYYGKRADREKHLKRLRNKPISLHADKKRPRKNVHRIKKLSKSDRKRLSLFSYKADEVKYDHFEQLNKLWQQYIKTLLPTKGPWCVCL